MFPFLFLLVAESLSRLISSTKFVGVVKGIQLVEKILFTHLLFIDDVLLFGDGIVRGWWAFKEILETFCLKIGMEINANKSLILCNELPNEVEVESCQ